MVGGKRVWGLLIKISERIGIDRETSKPTAIVTPPAKAGPFGLQVAQWY